MRESRGERQERRRYGTDRAGASGRRFARERLRAFSLSHWKALLFPTLILLALAPVLWVVLTPIAEVRGFALGLYVAGVFASTYHWAVLASGAASISMGQEAEVWTDQELQRLTKHGWRILNHVVLRGSDIDHVAVGPDGVIVIETKWTASHVTLDGKDRWLTSAYEQAANNARDIRKIIQWGAKPDQPLVPLVVVWGPQVDPPTDELQETPDKVAVVAGRHLRQTLLELGETRLDQGEIDRIYEKVRWHIDSKDKHSPEPRSFEVVSREWSLRAIAAWAGLALSSLALQLGAIGYLVVQVLLIAAAIAVALRGPERAQPYGWAAAAGGGLLLVLLLGAIMVTALS